MQNDLTTQQSTPPPQQSPLPQPSHIGRIAVAIAAILFFIGLGLYVSSAEKFQPEGISERPLPPTTVGPSAKARHVLGQVIVKFKDGVSDDQIAKRLEPLDASVEKKIEGVNSTVIKVQPGQEEEVLKALSNDPLVKYAEPDYVYYLQFAPNDPDLGLQWELKNTGQTVNGQVGTAGVDMKVEEAWNITKGAGTRVAILDSGIDATHPEFANKIVASQAFASTSILDLNGHGTHVAGIIGATGNNSQGISGVCPECFLLIGKITGDDASGSVPTSAIAASIIWAGNSGAQVINMSIAGPDFSQTIQDAVNQAWSKNAVIVAAAGNEGTGDTNYPAAYDHVISVASTDSNDVISPTSNFGTWVSVAAPGVSIYSTYPTTPNPRNVTNYGYMSGTSMASPAVAGVAALIWNSQYGTSNTAVVQRLLATADKIPGTGSKWTFGRVNAASAVGVAVSPTVSPTAIITPSQIPTPSVIIPSTELEPTEAPVVIPTFVCAGSTSGICPTTPPVNPQYTPPVNPSGTLPTGGAFPTGGAVPTSGTTPGVTGTPIGSSDIRTLIEQLKLTKFNPSKIPGCKHQKKSVGGVGNFVEFLIGLIFALIQSLLQRFGIK